MSSTRKNITQASIAARLNISRSTVAAVLCDLPTARISPEVRQRVLDTAAEMGYVPNRYAQAMRKGRTGVIGILNFGTNLQVALQKLRLAVSAIHAEGYEAMVHDVFWFADRGNLACRRMMEARVEGVVLVQPNLWFTQKHLDSLLAAGIPVVGIGGYHLKKIPVVSRQTTQGFYELTRHLLRLGHRRLTLLLGKDSSENHRAPSAHRVEAIAGFRRALREMHGKTDGTVHVFHHQLTSETEGMDAYLPGKFGMREILQKPVLPTAVLCGNDNWAMGALSACAEADVRVPRDIAITGYENEPVSAVGLLPLTTVAQPVKEITAWAMEKLFSAIRGQKKLREERVLMPIHLIVRRSCGATLLSIPPEQKEKNPNKKVKTYENQNIEVHS